MQDGIEIPFRIDAQNENGETSLVDAVEDGNLNRQADRPFGSFPVEIQKAHLPRPEYVGDVEQEVRVRRFGRLRDGDPLGASLIDQDDSFIVICGPHAAEPLSKPRPRGHVGWFSNPLPHQPREGGVGRQADAVREAFPTPLDDLRDLQVGHGGKLAFHLNAEPPLEVLVRENAGEQNAGRDQEEDAEEGKGSEPSAPCGRLCAHARSPCAFADARSE